MFVFGLRPSTIDSMGEGSLSQVWEMPAIAPTAQNRHGADTRRWLVRGAHDLARIIPDNWISFQKENSFMPDLAFKWHLGSELWAERCAMERANFICQRCHKEPATEVHHLTHVRVFNELASDL